MSSPSTPPAVPHVAASDPQPGSTSAMLELFAGPGVEWTGLSPHYPTYLRLMAARTWVITAVVLAVPAWVFLAPWVAWTAAAVCLVIGAWRCWLAGRIYRSWGYAERASDLYIRHGLWSRHLTVVPYGRMQAVQVNSGPIMRRLGIAQVNLVTASLQTDATIPGIPADAAATLRDRLTELGEQQAAAL